MNTQLGFFDSGVGGFTVLKSIFERHGNIPAVYLGDTSRVPYGNKKTSDIRLIAREIIEWLNEHNVIAVIVACNTTNSLAIEIIKKYSRAPVFGLIESVQEMIFESRVGVIATPSTISSRAYSDQIIKHKPGIFVIEQSCPSFVPMIETGQLHSEEMENIAKEYLKPLLEANVQSIIMGCSHYPLLESVIRKIVPENVRLIDPSHALAKKLDQLLGYKSISNQVNPNYLNVKFCSTSDPHGFSARAQHWLGVKPKVELVSLTSNACVL